ncbi:MAG: amino acid permease [Symbiopectobacterium sp.]|uniref:amino acid permease n=1 Tax=Symbiopectobacterium sp. TaxID=2952789 RepID=UPI0039EA4E94
MASSSVNKLSLWSLTALVVGSMIGAGIFSLPATFGRATGGFGAIIAWCIAGGGMLMLTFVFQSLAQRKPDLDSVVFIYAKEGFGDYLGFASALGFWAGTCIGNVSHFVPIIAFVGVLIFAFQSDIFIQNFWGSPATAPVTPDLEHLNDYGYVGHAAAAIMPAQEPESLFSQIRSTMLVTVFVFLGIEGASVYSRYAKERRHVGIATVMGFIGVLGLLVLITLLSYGVLLRPELAGMRQPSMAGVLEAVVGPWGRVFISVGLIVSVLGAYLSWSLLAAEVLFSAAKHQSMPKVFMTENKHAVPSAAVWLTNITIQVFLILMLFSQYAFQLAIELTSSLTLIPYLLVAAYGLKLAWTGETYETDKRDHRKDLTFALLATLYALLMLYAGGMKYLLLSAVIYGPGTVLYIMAKREQRVALFNKTELGLFAIVMVAAIVAIYSIATSIITI